VISKLRENPQFQDLAVLDIYQHPTVAGIAAILADRQQHPTSTQYGATSERTLAEPLRMRISKPHASGHIWTILGIYVLYFIYSTPIVLPFSIFDTLHDNGWNKYVALGISGIVLLSIHPVKTSINDGASLVGYEIVDGRLEIGNITIGRDCFVGSNTMLGLHTQLADRSRIGDLYYLGNGLTIPSGETWIGSPAKLDSNTSSQVDEILTPVPKCGNLLKLGYLIGSIGIWLVPFISAIPGFLLWQELLKELEIYELLIPAAVLGSFSFIGIFCLQVLLYKWILLGKVKPGNYPVYSSFGLRKWWVDRLMSMSLEMMPTLYSTLYLLPWLRMLGAKIGARTEISTATNITPDLLSIGSESFIADTVYFAVKVDRGWMELAPTNIGSQTFVGNGALVPAHSTIADNSLIGCFSIPPVSDKPMQPDTAWLGSPAIYIPHREVIDSYEEAQTYKPPRHLYAIRLAIEFLRVTLPGSIHFIVLFTHRCYCGC
jgi:non-ribosomal peptide synthetase-like protein